MTLDSAAASARYLEDTVPIVSEAVESATVAGLRYVTDRSAGIARRRRGKGFGYTFAGKRVTDSNTLQRIRALAVPPAWTDVWICPRADGHLQATGRDVRGRKQYRYHPAFRAVRDAAKYERAVAFAEALPRIRRRVSRDLRRSGMPREKLLAALVRLLELTLVRVGNEEYAIANRSYGLTTLRNRHALVRGDTIRLAFRGKGGKDRLVEATDPLLARIVRRCQDLPGQELFRWIDADGEVRSIGSSDVNDYLRDISGSDFTAKDFRTWGATLLATAHLARVPFASAAEAKRNVVEAIRSVSDRLGNTPAICRRCYVHPLVLEAYEAGRALPKDRRERSVREFLRVA